MLLSDRSGQISSNGSPSEESDTMQRPELLPSSSVTEQILAKSRLPEISDVCPPLPEISDVCSPMPSGVSPLPSPTFIVRQFNYSQVIELQGETVEAVSGVNAELSVESSSVDSESAITELKRRLDLVRQWIELQREAVKLQKQARPFITSDSSQPWAYRWIASVFAYCCSEEMREEFLGDLFEANRQLSTQNYPRWLINGINVVQVIRLLLSIVEVRLSTWLTLWSKK